MNRNGNNRQSDYLIDRNGNVYTRDGKYVGKAGGSQNRSSSYSESGQSRDRAYRENGQGGRYRPDGYSERPHAQDGGNRKRYYSDGERYNDRTYYDKGYSSQNNGYYDRGKGPYAGQRGTPSRQKKRKRSDPRLGKVDRTRVRHERAGIRQYKGAPPKRIPTDIIIISVAIVVVAVLILILLKTAFTEHIGDLPDYKKRDTTVEVTETDSESTSAPESERAVYAERSEITAQLGTSIDCTHAILIDVGENSVVADKGGEERIFPASMTKVMTALVAVEKCESLDTTFTMTNEIISPLAAANASVAGFTPGEVITVRDLLYGTLLPSGADATGALAVLVSGNESDFAVLMNEKCSELGLVGTHFTNASGLHDDNHYSTCHDIAVIMKTALENPTLKEILGTYTYTTSKTPEHPDGITLYDTMFSRVEGKEEFDEKIEIFAGKTGYTGEAGNCLVSAAKVVGTDKTWIFVCAGGESKWKPIYDTIHVYRTYLGVAYDGEYVPKYMR